MQPVAKVGQRENVSWIEPVERQWIRSEVPGRKKRKSTLKSIIVRFLTTISNKILIAVKTVSMFSAKALGLSTSRRLWTQEEEELIHESLGEKPVVRIHKDLAHLAARKGLPPKGYQAAIALRSSNGIKSSSSYQLF